MKYSIVMTPQVHFQTHYLLLLSRVHRTGVIFGLEVERLTTIEEYTNLTLFQLLE